MRVNRFQECLAKHTPGEFARPPCLRRPLVRSEWSEPAPWCPESRNHPPRSQLGKETVMNARFRTTSDMLSGVGECTPCQRFLRTARCIMPSRSDRTVADDHFVQAWTAYVRAVTRWGGAGSLPPTRMRASMSGRLPRVISTGEACGGAHAAMQHTYTWPAANGPRRHVTHTRFVLGESIKPAHESSRFSRPCPEPVPAVSPRCCIPAVRSGASQARVRYAGRAEAEIRPTT